jgi:uncharacterized membrane protein
MEVELVFKKIRNLFFTGLLVLLPVVISLKIVIWGFEKADQILGDLLHLILLKYFNYEGPTTGLGLILLLVLITLTGIFAKNYLGKKLIRIGEGIFKKIPILNTVYNTAKQIMDSLSNQNKNAFRKVVLIEYPRPGIYSPGFLIGDAPAETEDKTGKKMVIVFVPTTPNPATGYLAFVPLEDVIMLDMSVEDGFKLMLSFGVIKLKENEGLDIPKAMTVGKGQSI